MSTASRHGLPVPSIVVRGAVDRWPILVTSFAEGELADRQLALQPTQPQAIGRVLGETLGALHRITAPDGVSRSGEWVDRAGIAIEPIRECLVAVEHQDRLIHLDFHPRNVMLQDGRVTGVLDWENALAGPPHMDLARSRAILRVAVLGILEAPMPADVIEAFERGLNEGHESVAGTDPHPELSAAWGLAMTVEDVLKHTRKPGVAFDREALKQIETERDAAIVIAGERQGK